MHELKECEEYMTPKERIIGLILGKQLDRIPVFPFVTAAAAQVLHVHYPEYCTNPDTFIKCQIQAQELFGYDAVTSIADLCVEAQAFGAELIYPEHNAPYPNPYKWILKSPEDYRHIGKLFNWDKAERMKNQLHIIKNFKEKITHLMVGGASIGPVGILSRLRNPNDLVRDFIYHKEELHEALEQVTEIQIEFIEKQIEAGAGTIMIPVVLAERELMSKKMWEEIDAPYQKKIADFVRSKGVIYAAHTCGRGPYFDLLIKWLKPTLIQNAFLPDDCKTEEEMVEKYGNKLILLGYLSVQMLAWSSPREVFAECKRQIDVFGKSHLGYLLGASCEYPPYAPLYNAMAMVKAAKIFGANYKRGGN